MRNCGRCTLPLLACADTRIGAERIPSRSVPRSISSSPRAASAGRHQGDARRGKDGCGEKGCGTPFAAAVEISQLKPVFFPAKVLRQYDALMHSTVPIASKSLTSPLIAEHSVPHAANGICETGPVVATNRCYHGWHRASMSQTSER